MVWRSRPSGPVPWESSSLVGNFYLNKSTGAVQALNRQPVEHANAPTFNPAAIELSYWETIKNSTDPEDFKAYLKKYPNGQFADLAQRRAQAPSNSRTGNSNTTPVEDGVEYKAFGQPVPRPSSRYRTFKGGNLFNVQIPDNWREFSESQSSVWFAPEGAHGQLRGKAVYTHGVNVGVSKAQGHNLRESSDYFINSLAQGNRDLRAQGGYQRGTIDGRDALAITLSNINEATRSSEKLRIYTTFMRNGQLFYMIEVAPDNDYQEFQIAFGNVLRSIRLND